MSAPEPVFVQQITEWLSSEQNIATVDELGKLTHQRDIRIRQSELIQHLQLQPLLRPRLTKIPGFWPWTLSRCSTFSRACTAEKDWDCLSYLEDLEFVVDPRDYRAFDLIFHFKENPYFSNSTLTKSYVPTSGPSARIGLTASELIGLARPSGISTYTPASSSEAANGEKIGGLKVDKVEGERKWDLKEVEQGTEESVREAIAFFDEMDDLVGLKTEINWKSDEVNLCKLFPQEDAEPSGSDDGFDSGDRGSFFFFFQQETDSDGLASILWQDVVPNCISYFEGQGADNDSQADDSMDEEFDSDDDGEIDLVSEEDELEDKKEERPTKRTRTQ